MKFPISILSSVVLVLFCFVSCTKEDIAINTASGKSLLLAHTWHLQEVTELVSGKSIVVYRRGSADNAEDFSLVRQSFKADGSVQFTDQFGNTSIDGEFELNHEDSKIKLALGPQHLIGEQVAIGTSQFVYTVKLSEVDAVRYRFSPSL